MLSVHDPQCVKLLSRLKFSHLNEHRFRNNFKECLSHMCGCGLEIESTQHFLHCRFYHVERSELLNSLQEIVLAINELKRKILL